MIAESEIVVGTEVQEFSDRISVPIEYLEFRFWAGHHGLTVDHVLFSETICYNFIKIFCDFKKVVTLEILEIGHGEVIAVGLFSFEIFFTQRHHILLK